MAFFCLCRGGGCKRPGNRHAQHWFRPFGSPPPPVSRRQFFPLVSGWRIPAKISVKQNHRKKFFRSCLAGIGPSGNHWRQAGPPSKWAARHEMGRRRPALGAGGPRQTLRRTIKQVGGFIRRVALGGVIASRFFARRFRPLGQSKRTIPDYRGGRLALSSMEQFFSHQIKVFFGFAGPSCNPRKCLRESGAQPNSCGRIHSFSGRGGNFSPGLTAANAAGPVP